MASRGNRWNYSLTKSVVVAVEFCQGSLCGSGNVIINNNTFNYPTINVEAVIRSLNIRRQAAVQVAPGISLELRKANVNPGEN